MEKTFVFIKPNAIQQKNTGAIIQMFEREGLELIGLKQVHVSKSFCEAFYSEHKGRPFYQELVNFISSSPIVAMALEGPQGTVKRVREIMGDTDPQRAEPGTIRHKYGNSIGENAIHGSDSLASAQRELSFFFSKMELFSEEHFEE